MFTIYSLLVENPRENPRGRSRDWQSREYRGRRNETRTALPLARATRPSNILRFSSRILEQ